MRSLSRTVLPAVAVAVAAGTAFAPQAQAADPTGPAQISFPPALAYSFASPTALPPGTNDWSCKPSAAHPRPVVLVHGTWANRYDSFALMAPQLKAAGYCVYALNFGDENESPLGKVPGVYATAPVKQGGNELSTFVEQVRSQTGSAKVDLFGWSQGGLTVRSYLKFYGGADKVTNAISFGATSHGTTLSGLATLGKALGIIDEAGGVIGAGGTDQVTNSPFIQELNAGGDTVPGVNYTVIGTKYDEVSTPYKNTFLTAGPGATVKNVTLQDGCEVDFSDHISGMYSLRMIGLVKKALDPGGNVFVPCLPRGPVFSTPAG